VTQFTNLLLRKTNPAPTSRRFRCDDLLSSYRPRDHAVKCRSITDSSAIEAQRCGSNLSPAGSTGGSRLYDHLSVDRPPAGLQHVFLLIPSVARSPSHCGMLWAGYFFRCPRRKSAGHGDRVHWITGKNDLGASFERASYIWNRSISLSAVGCPQAKVSESNRATVTETNGVSEPHQMVTRSPRARPSMHLADSPENWRHSSASFAAKRMVSCQQSVILDGLSPPPKNLFSDVGRFT
jgi:hypothetical protein